MRRYIKLIWLFSSALIILLVTECNDKKPTAISESSGFAGLWRLVSGIDKTDTGEIINEPSLGSDPIALLMYDNLGNMSVQIMKRERISGSVTSIQQSSINSVAFNGYDAYFGTYIIDNLNHQIKHQIKGAIDPEDISKELVRNYSISRDALLLWFNTSNSNVTVTRTLTWVRNMENYTGDNEISRIQF
jgi:hypothetical protein